jgi:hypothetical protein
VTLEEAKAIVAKAEEREMPTSGPVAHYHEDGIRRMVLEVEGHFTAEEFEAMAVIVRASATE